MMQEKQAKLTEAQLVCLSDLAYRLYRDNAQAKRTRRASNKGLTYFASLKRFGIRLSTVQFLIRKGLVQGCCSGHEGRDVNWITEAGLAYLNDNESWSPVGL